MRRYIFYGLLIASCFLTGYLGHSQNKNTIKQEGFIKSLSYIEDKHFDLSAIKTQKLSPTNTSKINIVNGVYWFKVELKNIATKKEIIFKINESSIDFIEVYNETQKITGINNNIGLTNIALKIKNLGATIYYIKVNFPIQVHFPLTVVTTEQHQATSLTYLFKNGWYYGLVFMVFVINLFFYFSLKETLFLLYALFLITINFVFSHYDGFCNFITSPSTRYFTHSISHFIATLTGVLFATEFLNLHRYIPKSKKTGATLLAVSLFIYFLHLYTNKQIYYIIANFVAFAALCYYWILGFITLGKNSFSKFFVIGYSLLLFSGIFYILPMGLGVSTISISLSTLKFAAFFEMLVLTYAITYRVKMMKEENEIIRNEIQNHIKQLYNLEEKIDSQSKVDKNESLISKIENLKTTHSLTIREVDVLICLSKGYTNQKISEELFVSLNTIKYHTRNIYQKLNIKTKNEAVSLLIT
tara:strand:- start:32722 stop:34134 length:1413 start_codon:yes stop_codon:yes gene_type:complete